MYLYWTTSICHLHIPLSKPVLPFFPSEHFVCILYFYCMLHFLLLKKSSPASIRVGDSVFKEDNDAFLLCGLMSFQSFMNISVNILIFSLVIFFFYINKYTLSGHPYSSPLKLSCLNMIQDGL